MGISQGFPSSNGKIKGPIGKNAKKYGGHVEFVWIHGFAAEISRVKGVSGPHCGGWALGQSGAPG